MSSIILHGKMSTFGGPADTGVSPSEGLALFEPSDLTLGSPDASGLFLAHQPPGTTGLARRLNPASFYIACRWDYSKTPRHYLRMINVRVTANGYVRLARPVDWGPHVDTGRIADLSPALAGALRLKTDDHITIEIPLP